MKAAFVGFFTTAVCVALLGALVPDEEVRRPMWLFVFLALAACSKFSWSHPNAPETPRGWLSYVALALGSGLVLAFLDAMLHGPSSNHMIFDFSLSILGGIVALSCFARSLCLPERNGA